MLTFPPSLNSNAISSGLLSVGAMIACVLGRQRPSWLWGEERVMKAASFCLASVAIAVLSVASASAENKTLATTTGNCSTTTWPMVSPVQCTKPMAHNYVECTEMIGKSGARPSDAWWWCSNQGFKN
jgi:hypothetical protein